MPDSLVIFRIPIPWRIYSYELHPYVLANLTLKISQIGIAANFSSSKLRMLLKKEIQSFEKPPITCVLSSVLYLLISRYDVRDFCPIINTATSFPEASL